MTNVAVGYGQATAVSVSGSAGSSAGFGSASGNAGRNVYSDGFVDSLFLHPALSYNYGLSLVSGIGFHLASSLQYQAGGILLDALNLHEAASPQGKYKQTISGSLMFHDVFVRGFPVTLTRDLGLHDASTVKQGTTIAGKLQLHDSPSGVAHYTMAILGYLNFHGFPARFVGGTLVSGIGHHDAVLRTYQAVAGLSQVLALHDAIAANGLLLQVSIDDDLDFDDDEILKSIYRGDILQDGINFVTAYVDPGGGFTTWAINTRTSAITEYYNYAFNSMCKFGHRYLGADSTGLWAMDGALDDDDAIPTRIKAGWMQLAGSRFTSFKAAYLGLRVHDDGQDFILKLHAGDGREYVYAVKPNNMMTTKVNMGKGLRSRYFAFELITDGPDYDLDSVEFVPITSQRRV